MVVPVPELSHEQILDLLQRTIAELVGVDGSWTLIPRRLDDTDVIFHGLKADQIARELATALRVGKAALLLEPATEPAAAPAAAGRLSKTRASELPSQKVIEPTALSWTPAPISVWADPARATVTGPVDVPITAARLVA